MAKAEVIAQTKINPMTEKPYRTYRWVGDPRGVAEVESTMLTKIDLPWPYEILKYDFHRGTTLIYRLDTPPSGYVWNRLAADADRIAEWWRFTIIPRLVLTAQIWGLAYVPLGEIPTFNHLLKRAWMDEA